MKRLHIIAAPLAGGLAAFVNLSYLFHAALDSSDESFNPQPCSPEDTPPSLLDRLLLHEDAWALGRPVTILSGPLQGQHGAIHQVFRQRETVSVIISRFGRNIPIELPLWAIQIRDL